MAEEQQPQPEALDEYRAVPDQEIANEEWAAPKDRKLPNFDEFLDKVDLLLDLCKVLYEEDQSAPRPGEGADAQPAQQLPHDAGTPSGHTSTPQGFDEPFCEMTPLNLPGEHAIHGRSSVKGAVSRPGASAARFTARASGIALAVAGAASRISRRPKPRNGKSVASLAGDSLPQHCARIQWRALRNIQHGTFRNRSRILTKKQIMNFIPTGETTLPSA